MRNAFAANGQSQMGRHTRCAQATNSRAGLCGQSQMGRHTCSAPLPQIPLSFLRDGESASIIKIRGKNGLHRHLENLGFVEGAQVKVVSETPGDLIVEIKGSRVALNRQVAAHIITAA